MSITVDFWQLVTLLLAFFGFVAGAAKLFFDQVEKRMGERFETVTRALGSHMAEERVNAAAVVELERSFLKWQADMPLQYVRREDYVRGQSVIEAKLDKLYSKLEIVQIKGAGHG
ncbi:hypothetical protein [Rhodocyclus tenuis]|uniref:Uncharacterized protein n=1 Tax=Rhodocyclus tenuis TaxID=1066 RepID=A0A840G950_RHOTE|nr:hypothetical protein [Rhodocyclus tenuis]MBB4248376.1 hypothetical protein [Rhodocyclus tenuis]